MSVNISSYSWNRSFFVFHPTSHRGTDGMFYVVATIYKSALCRPMRCHKCSPHRKTAPWTQTFVPTGQECQEKTHPQSTPGVSAADTHPLSRPRGSWASPGGTRRGRLCPSDARVCIASGYKQRKQYTKCPKLAAVKNINKANPSLPRRLATFICMFMSIC